MKKHVKQSKIVKKFKTIIVKQNIVRIWCAEESIKEYWANKVKK